MVSGISGMFSRMPMGETRWNAECDQRQGGQPDDGRCQEHLDDPCRRARG